MYLYGVQVHTSTWNCEQKSLKKKETFLVFQSLEMEPQQPLLPVESGDC